MLTHSLGSHFVSEEENVPNFLLVYRFICIDCPTNSQIHMLPRIFQKCSHMEISKFKQSSKVSFTPSALA